MTVPRRPAGAGQGYSWNRSFSRRRNRLGTCARSWFFSRRRTCTAASWGSPKISPRSQRLLVTQERPLEKVMMVRLQGLPQKGHAEAAIVSSPTISPPQLLQL